MIVRTDAVVLRSFRYGETSLIVTLFTREKGKLTVMAKGARLPKSRFGSTLQPMSYVQVVFYYRPTRDLQVLSEAAHIEPLHDLGRDLEKIGVGLRLVELVHALLQPEEHSPAVFHLLVQSLLHLDAAPARAWNVLPYFQLRLAARLGFSPALEREAVQQLPDEGGLLALDTGAILPPFTALPHGHRARRSVLRAFAICARADLEVVLRMHLEADERIELDDLVEAFLRYHFHDAYPTRGSRIIGQIIAQGNAGGS